MSAWIDKKTWTEFKDIGMLWWVNRLLHLFGWAIVVQQDDDGTITEVFPARSKFRGFAMETEQEHYEEVARYLRDNAVTLYDEAEYPPKEKP